MVSYLAIRKKIGQGDEGNYYNDEIQQLDEGA